MEESIEEIIAKILAGVIIVGAIGSLLYLGVKGRESIQQEVDACNARGGWYDMHYRICQKVIPQ